jgi:nicotinamidase-related amidase
MRVLADAAFPQSVAGPHETHLVDRYRGSPVSDPDLVTYASDQGYDVLVLLGASAIAEERVLEAARHAGITVAATYETEPEKAASLVTRRLKDIARLRNHIALVVKTRGVDPQEAG